MLALLILILKYKFIKVTGISLVKRLFSFFALVLVHILKDEKFLTY